MPLVHDGIRGVADFLERGEDPDGNTVWTPVDAKLARNEAKVGHLLQLCFYAEALEAITGRAPEEMPGDNNVQGCLPTLLLGLGGALLGWLFFTKLLGIGDSDVFDLGGLIGAVIGAVVLLFAWAAIAGRDSG